MTATFDKLLVDALPRLRRYALSLTREPDAARDLVQAAAVRALAADERPTDATSVLAWLIRITRNAFVDERRRAVHHDGDDLTSDIPEDGSDAVRTLAVRQALAALDRDGRDVVTLVDVVGLTYREAADRLGIPVGTVMSRLSRARGQLVSILLADDA